MHSSHDLFLENHYPSNDVPSTPNPSSPAPSLGWLPMWLLWKGVQNTDRVAGTLILTTLRCVQENEIYQYFENVLYILFMISIKIRIK